MLANTLALAVSGATGTPFTLTRVNQDNFGSQYNYLDAIQKITLKIRHSVDTVKADPSKGIAAGFFNRHNATIEHTVFATPTVAEKSCTATITLRDGKGYAPTELLAFWVGFNALFLAQDDAIVVGDN